MVVMELQEEKGREVEEVHRKGSIRQGGRIAHVAVEEAGAGLVKDKMTAPLRDEEGKSTYIWQVLAYRFHILRID